MQETLESWPVAAQNRQAAARARHDSECSGMSRVNTLWRLASCSGVFAARWMVGCAGGSQAVGGSLQLWIVSYLGSLPRVLATPGDGKASLVRSRGCTIHSARQRVPTMLRGGAVAHLA